MSKRTTKAERTMKLVAELETLVAREAALQQEIQRLTEYRKDTRTAITETRQKIAEELNPLRRVLPGEVRE